MRAPERQHDDTGCTVMSLDDIQLVECECVRYRPDCGDPTLFGADLLVPATSTPNPRAREPT